MSAARQAPASPVDASMMVWRIRGALCTLLDVVASGTGKSGAALDIDPEHLCGLLALVRDELDRLDAAL